MSRRTPDPASATTLVAYRALTVCGTVFQRPSAERVSSCRWVVRPITQSSTPYLQRRTASTATVWAPPRSLTTTRGMLSSPRGTEMFQFPRCPSSTGRSRMPMHDHRQVAPFGYPRISARSTTPRGFSQSCHVLPRPQAPRHPPLALPTPFPHRVASASRHARLRSIDASLSQLLLLFTW